ncbi:MAG: nucleotidyltransferase family protein [Lachnospiraceae bacterium]|nr:nucleotidyltransferase family protein [Lachnospiraceae bacterium]MCI9152042.1 nucleotidyltransferase family protein [Lachnospiraceae bacterium]
MKITGIIAEYNPFHKGHQYQISQVRKRFGCDYIIAVISGDFVQRGAPALLDKYTRAHMALLGGADLVLELPAVYATASAEGFAAGGIRTLAATGITDSVSFGMEQDDTDTLMQLADLLTKEPAWYCRRLREGLQKGLSYPAARSRALPEYADFLASPNNILALEYARAAQAYAPELTLLPIRRLGGSYHQKELSGPLASAGAIRAFLREHADMLLASRDFGTESISPKASALADALPESSWRLLAEYSQTAALLYEEALSLPLHLKLTGQTMDSLLCCSDMSPALASRILAMRADFASFPGFCEALKTKNITYSRISRALLHLLLGITRELTQQAEEIPYLRLLGFRRSAAGLLGRIRQEGTAPLLTSLPDACPDTGAAPSVPLTQNARAILESDLYAHDLYRALITARTSCPRPREFRQKMLVVEA